MTQPHGAGMDNVRTYTAHDRLYVHIRWDQEDFPLCTTALPAVVCTCGAYVFSEVAGQQDTPS